MAKKRLVVLTGAGISAESGFSTFRDNNGYWDKYDPEDVASIRGWERDRQYVLDFYNGVREQLRDASPNRGHMLIASLEKDYDVDVITQNVDNLHERAGSTRVLHLHGEVTKMRPEKGAYDRDFSLSEVFDIGYERVDVGDLAPNGTQLRPHIVWFGEAVPNIEKAMDIVMNADIFLIVGSSLSVYPAAGLYRYVREDVPIYVIDPKEVNLRDKRMVHIREKGSVGMEKFIKILENSR